MFQDYLSVSYDYGKTYSSAVMHTPDTKVFMIALSKIMKFDCQLYLKTNTNHVEEVLTSMPSLNLLIITSTKQTVIKILKILLAFYCFTGCDSTRSFAGKSKLKPLSFLSSDEDCIYGFSQVGRSRTVTEEIVRILEKFVCEMYGEKQWIQIYLLLKLGITSTVIWRREYHWRCYHH